VTAHYSATRDGAALRVDARGDWTAAVVREIDAGFAGLPFGDAAALRISTAGIESLDLAGAWLIHGLAHRAGVAGLAVEWPDGMPGPVRVVFETLDKGAHFPAPPEDDFRPVSALGRTVIDRWRATVVGVEFIGAVAASFWRAMLHPRRWRPISIARHVYDTGITAIPIVSLIAFLISVIIAYMGAQQLLQFGADIFVVDLVTVGVLRELGVLLTAIIVAGRSGSAFAAEIGAMRLNEEVDALKATGVDPLEVLVLPRLAALVIALPLLTVIADAVGLAGGALLCRWLLDMPFVQYFGRMDEAIAPTTFWAGLIKAPVFAALIAIAGTYRGMQVRGSSRELGRLTTVAVVQAIFLVILADAIFAVIFMELDF
jgi:phospholipid/cholesterol/gamma-HCH transport system permease protein